VRALGIDLGGTSVKWVLLEESPERSADAAEPRVVARGETETQAEHGPSHVLDRLAQLADAAAAHHGRPDSVGLGLPGPLDLERGRVVFMANLPGWDDVPVVELLSSRVGIGGALVNDARAFTLGELELGAARGSSDVVGITIGTGVGGGIVVGGRLQLGLNGNVGEIGHQTLVPDGPLCGCGNRGCLEAYAAGPAIARAAGMGTADRVVAAARAGDGDAVAVLERAGAFLGIGIANILVCVGPDTVVVGGGVATDAGDLLLEPARRELERRCRTVPLDRVRLVPAALGTTAGAIGAAVWALHTHR
jgi:glucokinase